ncbi:single-stranded DNA-binding protein [Arcanobacterium hippocoleae]|uniref:Single-strand DNA-binding protein n=1 Tax=Arcanobacterium hippocoleae TaxID=149017 RepID=A0ABU1T1G6_9ACTO|nr:single-stranded DNA-binding protein [Arcanobacterium hippocoleae]MDR6939163.1 single-strand DNA-binding protein [Arcanobacterium hippocoleae]
MANNETVITIRGWAGAAPTLYRNESTTSHGTGGNVSRASAVLNVGVTPRNFSRKSGQYEDGETAWYSVRSFGKLAENVAACVQKGAPLLVRGKLTARSFQAKDGTTRINQVIIADAIGIELNSGTATYQRGNAVQVNPANSIVAQDFTANPLGENSHQSGSRETVMESVGDSYDPWEVCTSSENCFSEDPVATDFAGQKSGVAEFAKV